MSDSVARALARLDNEGDRVADLCASLLRFESPRPDDADPSEPLGPGLRDCLRFAMDECRKRGMKTRVHRGEVGVAELGDGPENVALVVHLDVVPAGDGWRRPPFSGDIVDGEVWGRGAQDDKGPLASILVAVDAILAEAIPLRRRVTIVLGTDEETGFWRDLKAFHEHEPMPTMSIIPDGSFPIASAEKGFAGVTLTISRKPLAGLLAKNGDLPRILSLQCGERVNIVPDSAEAVLEFVSVAYTEARARAYELSHPGAAFTVEAHPDAPDDRVILRAKGVPTHGSTPEKGRNALLDLVGLLAPEEWAPSPIEAGVRFLDQAIGHDVFCERVGLYKHDPFMGYCTVNAGLARTLDNGDFELRFNLRPVVGQSLDVVRDAFVRIGDALGKELDARFRVTLEETSREPFRIADDSELVRGLSAAYERVMGAPAECVSMGGTTFAKAFDNAVAFGPTMPDEEELAHERDERVSIAALVRNAKIYAAAICELAGGEPEG